MLKYCFCRYTMNSVITVLYFNGRVYEDNNGVIFEGSKKAIQIKRGISFNALKKKIGDKVKLQNNEIIFAISCRFLVSGKYIVLQICDDEDVETMLESFKQQDQMSVLELYIEKDVAGGSMFHSANSLTSCGNYLSNDETQLPTNMSNLHIDEDDDDDDDYLMSNSYVEESLDEDDSVDGIFDTDNEVTDIPQPVRIVYPAEGAQRIENPFWNDALHYNNIKWSCPDEEDICGLEMPSTFNVGQELYVGMEFDSKDAAFKYCKPIIQVDGTHLYGKYSGTLLMATSQDGNGGVLPLAFAVVEGLKDYRNIPIKALVKSTYNRCRKYFVERGRQAQRQLNEGQVYCSKLVKELRKNQEQACSHIVRVYDILSTRFEVEETFNPITQRGGQQWAVNLNGHYCQCGRYSAFHYPCSHIIAACGYVSLNYYQYIDVVYTNEHILKAYSAQWWPLGNEAAIPPSNDAWTLIPDPTTIRAKGRTKSQG
ncbi:hypothetical protein HKD37_07G018908 [Glycine soja]